MNHSQYEKNNILSIQYNICISPHSFMNRKYLLAFFCSASVAKI